MGPQLDSLVHAPHIVVGTPGRIQEHLRKKTLLLDELKVLVLDEADRMLDMGFADDIDDVISYTPPQRQTLLFSATYPAGIERISERVQRQPLSVEVDDDEAQTAIEQRFYETTRDQRPALLVSAIRYHQPASCVVFCNTKRDCQRCLRPGGPRHQRTGAAWRSRAARPRSGVGAFRQPQLPSVGGNRRCRSWAGHQRTGAGG